MSTAGYAASKASSESSNQSNAMDRFTLRNLQRLETERLFRDQRSNTSTSSQSPAVNQAATNGFNINTVCPKIAVAQRSLVSYSYT